MTKIYIKLGVTTFNKELKGSLIIKINKLREGLINLSLKSLMAEVKLLTKNLESMASLSRKIKSNDIYKNKETLVSPF